MNVEFNIYKDIQKRTNGELYIGVVGPVRTGKSTFIKRFMDLCVIPEIHDENIRTRAIDELPQSGNGKTIMTTEPKFIPNEAVKIRPSEGIDVSVRLIDCVGFMVDGAAGFNENEKERMVKTPWSNDEIPFAKAADIGTRKVIEDHSTVGIVITTDGTFTDIPREAYEEAERKAIESLKEIGKPFLVIVNTTKPYSKEAKEQAEKISRNYNITAMAANCEQLQQTDVYEILSKIIMEFPASEIIYYFPQWLNMLANDHELKKTIKNIAFEILDKVTTLKDTGNINDIETADGIDGIKLSSIDTSTGKAAVEISINQSIYYEVLSDLTSTPIKNDYELIHIIKELSEMKDSYQKVRDALLQVDATGFGVVVPDKSEITLEAPQLLKNGNRYGVKIRVSAPSINMLKTGINVEIAPIVGNKNQAEDLISYINENSSQNPEGIWDTNIFGKTIGQIVDDGIREKTGNITSENMTKISDTLEKVMNDNSGLVCLIV